MKQSKGLVVERDILIFAFRYSLGRLSYASYSVIRTIKDNIDNISTQDIKQYIKEIHEHKESNIYFDEEVWFKFAKYLEGELENRNKIEK